MERGEHSNSEKNNLKIGRRDFRQQKGEKGHERQKVEGGKRARNLEGGRVERWETKQKGRKRGRERK
eukprot:scaffold156169_cov31-Prasinocladus_malaysianus.AAC.1